MISDVRASRFGKIQEELSCKLCENSKGVKETKISKGNGTGRLKYKIKLAREGNEKPQYSFQHLST